MTRATAWGLAVFIIVVLVLLVVGLAKAQEEGRLCNGKPVTIYAVSHTTEPRSAPLIVEGTDGDDVILVVSDGVPPSDKTWVWAASGNDTVCIETDDAVVWGGPGDDWISGGSSEDWLKGQKGDDTIYGNGGHDVIWGGGGDDRLFGGRGDDELRGDTGNDSLDCGPDFDYGNDPNTVNCEAQGG